MQKEAWYLEPRGGDAWVLYLLRRDLFLLLTLRHVSPHMPAFVSLPEAIGATLTTHNTMGYCRRRRRRRKFCEKAYFSRPIFQNVIVLSFLEEIRRRTSDAETETLCIIVYAAMSWLGCGCASAAQPQAAFSSWSPVYLLLTALLISCGNYEVKQSNTMLHKMLHCRLVAAHRCSKTAGQQDTLLKYTSIHFITPYWSVSQPT